ncbi:MAG TPA: pitrilysin family protein [Gemmatimonadales bacterium]|nr:pitrilysin family protein [Gemmatimonadales bacterium]
MKAPHLLLALTVAVVPAAFAQQTPPKPRPAPAAMGTVAPHIPLVSYELPNGLTVLLSVDHTAPVVAVDVEHHVGSKNEEVGRTGFAHLFEHVMFTGSGHVPYGVHDKFTEGVGGSNNGSTNNDKTNFYESVPSNYLETELWLESDRLGWLLDALDINKLNAQRDIVKNERRQSVDNVPYGRVDEIMNAQMFPEGHPYHWPVIGSMADLSAASEADVKSFFKKWYGPNNTVLVIAGDFDPVQAKAWVARYFGPIPRGPAIVRPVVPAAHLDHPERFVYEDNVALPELFAEWPGVGQRSIDRIPLTVMGSIISGDRTQWLAQEFVYNRKWATSISLRPDANENVGTIDLDVVPTPGTDLTKLELAVDSVITRFKAEGPTPEQMKKATAGIEFSSYSRLQSMLGKAMTLASGWIYHGDPGWYAKDLTQTLAVSAADVKRVANTYLGANRIVLSAVPKGKANLASHADQSKPITSQFASKQEVGQ